jgi:hypothetical protein
MKIPILTALALLLALVGAHDTDINEEINLKDDRRLGEQYVNGCWWKWPYWQNGKCQKVEWCPDSMGNWVQKSSKDISWMYCWKDDEKKKGSSSSSSGGNKDKKCRKWRRKYDQCKRQRSRSKVSIVGLVSSGVLMCITQTCICTHLLVLQHARPSC